jgi:CRISPR/Cas system-associated exonuclease Cas4 (RecB family)
MNLRDEAYNKSTYQWEPGHEKMLRITKTSLTSDFTFCPQQYYYKRIEGRSSPKTDDMIRGTNVHDAIEEFYVLVRPVLDKALSFLEKGDWDEAFDLFWKSLPTPEEPYELDEEDILKVRMGWELERLLITKGKNYLPIINEDSIHAFTERKVEHNGETITVPLHFAGMIDRGFLNDDDTVSLMELKTGAWKMRWDKKQKKWKDDTFKKRSMRKEMAYYWDLLQKANHPLKDVSHWGWFYPGGHRRGLIDTDAEGNPSIHSFDHWDHEKANKKYITMNEKDLDALITAYLTKNFPPQPHQKKCLYCSFTDDCPAWQPGGENFWPRW